MEIVGWGQGDAAVSVEPHTLTLSPILTPRHFFERVVSSPEGAKDLSPRRESWGQGAERRLSFSFPLPSYSAPEGRKNRRRAEARRAPAILTPIRG